MIMRRPLVIAALALGIAAPALAQQKADLPKSGSFTVYSGWKAVGETTVNITDKHIEGAGTAWGVAFNTAGSGPLHMGPLTCTYTYEVIDGAGTSGGKCVWSDVNGDKIFTDYSGTSTPAGDYTGMNTITGGTGKFTGIQGKAPFQCKFLNAQGQTACTQQFAYQLTAEATGSTAPPSTAPNK
jgi:hypothetical protein